MRLRRFELKLGCIVLGVLLGSLAILRLAELPQVMFVYVFLSVGFIVLAPKLMAVAICGRLLGSERF